MRCRAGRVAKAQERRRMLPCRGGPSIPGEGSSIPASPARPRWARQRLCSPPLANQGRLGSAAGCTKHKQLGGISFRRLMMEKHLLGASAPSLLPARAGLGTASIDSDSGSMETSSGEARGGGAQSLLQRGSPARALVGSHSGIRSQDLISVPSSCPVPVCPLCRGGLCGGREVAPR